MKKIVAFLLCMAMLLSVVSVNAAQIYYDNEWHTYQGNIFTLKVDGKAINCEVPPIVFDDYSVVPARDVFEAMGATVDWNAVNQKVTVKYDSTKVEVYINKRGVKVNGVEKQAPIPAKLINGKTMIPVRFVSEALGFDVDFDSKTDTILIKTGSKQTEKPTVKNPASPTTKPTYNISLTKFTHSEKDGVVTADFTFTKTVKHSAFMLKEPARLVVDTENTQFPTTLKSAEVDYDSVTAIRLGQQEKGVRIVFDLTEETDFKASVSGKKLTVKIGKNIKDEPITEKTDEDEENEEEEKPEEIVPVIPDPPTYKPTRTVYIDPGHGGSDPGAIHTDEDGKIWKESDINLGVSLMVRDILKENNVKVLMSRDEDKTVELLERPADANEKQATLFVSIHTNSFYTDAPYGLETLGTLEFSATYAGITDKNLAENIHKAVIKETKAYNRGVKDSTTLAVLRHSVMPSVLIEVGFISNTEEREKLFSDDYRKKLAKGIAEGILKTLQEMGL